MATITNWVEHLSAEEVSGPLYPFVGTEWLWLTIAIVLWLGWHFVTDKQEQKEYKDIQTKIK